MSPITYVIVWLLLSFSLEVNTRNNATWYWENVALLVTVSINFSLQETFSISIVTMFLSYTTAHFNPVYYAKITWTYCKTNPCQ